MGASVGLTPYQESFAVDPNEILRKDHARDVATSQSSQATSTSHFVPKFEPLDFVKEETNFSEDEDEDTMQQQQQQQTEQQQLFHAISNTGDISNRYNNNKSNTSAFNTSSYNNSNNVSNSSVSNSNQNPQMIHSANSRLLNCSLLLNFGKSSSTSAQSSSSSLIGGDPYQHSPSPASPINNNNRRQSDLHLNVKLVKYLQFLFGKKLKSKNISFVTSMVIKFCLNI
jgi:hypothetical protein